jgi:hypothetical protein
MGGRARRSNPQDLDELARTLQSGGAVTDRQSRMSTDAEAAEAAARTVLRLLAVGDIEIVWLLLHMDYRKGILDEFSTSHAPELLAAYGPNLQRVLFTNAARQSLLSAVGGLAWAAAERRAHTVDVVAANGAAVITLEVDGEAEWRWDIEMRMTGDGWRWHHLSSYR